MSSFHFRVEAKAKYAALAFTSSGAVSTEAVDRLFAHKENGGYGQLFSAQEFVAVLFLVDARSEIRLDRLKQGDIKRNRMRIIAVESLRCAEAAVAEIEDVLTGLGLSFVEVLIIQGPIAADSQPHRPS